MQINLEAEDHRNFRDSVLDTLSTDNPIATPKLAEKVENTGDWKDNYLRNLMLPKMLHHLRGKDKVELDHEKRKGGHPTQFWVKNE